jgi:DNA-binding winged helix-turn-helix (wHTH) protein
MGRRYRSLDIAFDPGTATVLGPWGARPLRRQLAQCLVVLLDRAPALVTVDELLDLVWGRQAISPSAVPQAIKELRRALEDDARSPRFLETRHRLGYRWIAPVEVEDAPVLAPAGDHDATPAAQPEPTLDPMPGPADDASVAADAPRTRTAPDDLHGTPEPATEATPQGGVRRHARGVAWLGMALLAAIAAGVVVSRGWLASPANLAGDPRWRSAQEAFLDARLDAAEQALGEWAAPPAQVLALRARIAMRRAEPQAIEILRAARAAPGADDGETARWLSVLEAQAAGRDLAAWRALDPLLAMRPDDPQLLLAAWDLRKRMPSERVAALAERLAKLDGIPAARQTLLAAELAGYRRDAARRKERAQAVVDGYGTTHPALAALAQTELSGAAADQQDPERARRLALEAAAALEAQGLRRAALRALADAAWYAMVRDQLDDATADLDRMQRLVAGQGDPAGTALMHHYRAMLATRRGKHAEAIDLFTALAKDYEALGDLRAAAMALQASVAPRYTHGRGNEVPAVIERALVLAGREQAHDTIGFLNGTLGNHLVRSGDLDLGNERLLRALESFRIAGDRRAEATALGNLAEVAILRGRLDDAATHVERGLEVERALGSVSGQAFAQLRLARIFAGRGELARSLEAGELAVRGFAEVGNREQQAVARRHRGIVHLRRTEPAKARAERTAIAGIEEASPAIRAQGEYLAGEIAYYAGDFAAARRFADAAAALWKSADLPLESAQARIAALRARLAAGERITIEEEARRLLAEPVVLQSPALSRECGLVLVEALVASRRGRAAEDALAAVDAALVRAPDAEDTLRLAMLRAMLDADPSGRRERLTWAATQAERQGLSLLALEADGALAADSGQEALRAWRGRVASRAAGLALRGPAAGR